MLLRVSHPERPLVYACSGCSNAAQLTNYLAVKLDRMGLAEMACVTGVAAGIGHVMRIARSGRPIMVLDGCHLACARQCLENQDVIPDRHLIMTRLSPQMRYHKDYDPIEAERLAEYVVLALTEMRSETAGQHA
ncbi:putative zinc-binding protein [Zoogloeaceae bacterium G21618-S1]|nr:putative zinc-binding protein [Zoogloeaceae bacterium G21618-S1]